MARPAVHEGELAAIAETAERLVVVIEQLGKFRVEPLGLGKIYNNIPDYLLVWPFGYTKK